jgi:hypothetical protein
MARGTARVAPTKSSFKLSRGITLPTKAKAWRIVTPDGKVFKAVKAAKFNSRGDDFLVMRVLPYRPED